MDDNLDDYLDDEDIDNYGAPSAPIISSGNDIDTYGSPLGSVLDLDSYGSPVSDPLSHKSSPEEPIISGKFILLQYASLFYFYFQAK